MKFWIISQQWNKKPREDARDVAGVVSATPKLENLLYKLGSEFFLKKSLFTVCYTILKFLPSSLEERVYTPILV